MFAGYADFVSQCGESDGTKPFYSCVLKKREAKRRSAHRVVVLNGGHSTFLQPPLAVRDVMLTSNLLWEICISSYAFP